MRITRKLFFCIVVLVCLGSACGTQTSQTEANKERVYEIVEALNKYEDDYGFYPDTLDVLVPNYLPSIPKTVDDQVFRYELDQPTGFLVTFSLPTTGRTYRYCTYVRRLEGWDCGIYERHP